MATTIFTYTVWIKINDGGLRNWITIIYTVYYVQFYTPVNRVPYFLNVTLDTNYSALHKYEQLNESREYIIKTRYSGATFNELLLIYYISIIILGAVNIYIMYFNSC